MNWREFFASLVESLAWPAAIAFIVYLLRDAIRRRIRDLRRVRHGNTVVEFGDALLEVEKAAEQAELAAPELDSPQTSLYAELSDEIAAAPRLAVIEAWLRVEEELKALASSVGVVPTAPARLIPTALARDLARQGFIEPPLVSVIHELQDARNVAAHAHAYEVERGEVVDYVKLAGRVRSALRLAQQTRSAASEGQTTYDLLVYHDMTDPTLSSGGLVPSVGDPADRWFGPLGRDRHVVAVGPGIHEGRVTVVLAHGARPMPEIQALLDRAADDE